MKDIGKKKAKEETRPEMTLEDEEAEDKEKKGSKEEPEGRLGRKGRPKVQRASLCTRLISLVKTHAQALQAFPSGGNRRATGG